MFWADVTFCEKRVGIEWTKLRTVTLKIQSGLCTQDALKSSVSDCSGWLGCITCKLSLFLFPPFLCRLKTCTLDLHPGLGDQEDWTCCCLCCIWPVISAEMDLEARNPNTWWVKNVPSGQVSNFKLRHASTWPSIAHFEADTLGECGHTSAFLHSNWLKKMRNEPRPSEICEWNIMQNQMAPSLVPIVCLFWPSRQSWSPIERGASLTSPTSHTSPEQNWANKTYFHPPLFPGTNFLPYESTTDEWQLKFAKQLNPLFTAHRSPSALGSEQEDSTKKMMSSGNTVQTYNTCHSKWKDEGETYY